MKTSFSRNTHIIVPALVVIAMLLPAQVVLTPVSRLEAQSQLALDTAPDDTSLKLSANRSYLVPHARERRAATSNRIQANVVAADQAISSTQDSPADLRHPVLTASPDDCVSGYILVKIPASASDALRQQALQVVMIGIFGDVAVALVCQSEMQSLGTMSHIAASARQTRSLTLPYFDPARAQWQQARYAWYEENQGGYLVEHTVVSDPQTGAVLATTVLMAHRGEREGSITISRVNLISSESTSDQVITPQSALNTVLQHWQTPGVTVRIVLRFSADRPVWHIERSEDGGIVTYLVDGGNGASLGRYPLLDSVGSSPSQVPPASPMEYSTSPLASTGTPLASAGSVFVVGVDNTASWRDLSALAVVPAAARTNSGKPVVLLRSLQGGQDTAVSQFITLYNPSHIYYVGTSDPGAIIGANEVSLAANLAGMFWLRSPTVALAVNTDYTSTLLAAQVAARVDAPLLFVTATSVPAETQSRLIAMSTTSAIVVGMPAAQVLTQLQTLGISATVLNNAEAVARYTAARGPVDYVVVTNPADRSYAGWVPRLSLLAPALAAYHQGIVYPASYQVEWKITHSATFVTTAQPAGAWQGSNDFVCYEFVASVPPRSPGATWQVYPLQGKYAMSSMDRLAGDYWAKRVFYLAASSPSVTAFDRVLIDVNADGALADDEVFAHGQTFAVNDRLYRVSELDGDGDWGGRLDHVVLRFETWKLGTARVGGVDYPFVVTCGKASDSFGAYDVANIDMNHDGDFDDPGEGPFWPGDSVVLGTKRYAVTPGHDGSLRLTYPDAREIAADMWQQLGALGLDPSSIAIVAYYDAVPFGIYRDVMIDYEDVSSDMAFGDHDADPFLDASVGRVVGSDVFKTSALVARSITYGDLSGAWRERGLTLSNWSLDFPGAETTAKNVERQWQNVGMTVTGLYEADYANSWDVSLLQDRAFVAHFDHGTPMDPWNMRTITIKPTIGTFWGCSSAWIEGNPMYQNPVAFLDQGGVGYMGNTRLGAAPISEHAFSLFWNRIVNDRLPFGQAHRASVNFKVLDWLDSNQFGDLSLGYRLVYYGDPALTPVLTHTPAVTPAYTAATEIEPEAIVAYHGPGTWWTDAAHDHTRAYYAVTGPGIVSTGWFGTRYMVEQPIPDSVWGVSQVTSVPWPLGWTGHYFLDEGSARRAIWMLVPLDYDSSNGQILGEAPYLEYQLLSRFKEVGEQARVSGTGGSHGVAWGDYDGDGKPDLYVTSFNATDMLFHNNGDGTFGDVTAAAGLTNPGHGRTPIWGDYDNDGNLDLYVTREGGLPAELWRNNGNGTFANVTAVAGVGAIGGMSAAWGDYERDGFIDILVARWCGTPLLYHNNHDGTFAERAAQAGLTRDGCGVGAVFGDYDGTGDLGIYLTFLGGDNALYRNNSDGTFADVTATAGVSGNGKGEGAAWGDYDNDGDLDLFVSSDSNYPSLLYRNDGNGTFSDVAPTAGLTVTGIGRGVAWGDYDNDGWLDLAALNWDSLVLYHNNHDGRFSVVTGHDGLTPSLNGNGLAWGDYDDDGDLDLYLTSMGGANHLYRNTGRGNWLVVKLIGTRSNRSGIGARVQVTGGGLSQTREVSGGSGFHSQDSLPVEFGLGANTGIVDVQVRWPSGIVQTLRNVSANRYLDVVESQSHDVFVPIVNR